MLTPARRYDAEILEDPHIDRWLIARSLADVARANTVLGGANAAVTEIERSFEMLPPRASMLDVGTGAADIPRRTQRAAQRRGITLRTIGLDAELELAVGGRHCVTHAVCGDALSLPFRDRSIDIVMCPQVLHHFRDDAAITLLREMHRVARIRVVVSDLQRSWIAAGGIWLASFPLGFHPVSRHDGVVSVMRGFTPRELADTVHEAVGVRPVVRKRLGYRVTTSWTPE